MGHVYILFTCVCEYSVYFMSSNCKKCLKNSVNRFFVVEYWNINMLSNSHPTSRPSSTSTSVRTTRAALPRRPRARRQRPPPPPWPPEGGPATTPRPARRRERAGGRTARDARPPSPPRGPTNPLNCLRFKPHLPSPSYPTEEAQWRSATHSNSLSRHATWVFTLQISTFIFTVTGSTDTRLRARATLKPSYLPRDNPERRG